MTGLLSKRPDQFAPGVWPGYFSRAKGVEVWDLDGNRYIDMSISGIGANVLGYADPDVDTAVKKAIDSGISCSLNCPEEVELADLLCEIHPWADMVRYARTGGESMAMAVRIARAYTGKDKIAFCGYHGWHDWYLAANLGTGDALEGHLLAGLEPRGVPQSLKGTALPFRYNRIEELKEIMVQNKGQIAAIVMEPIRNEQPEPDYFDEVMALAKENKAVFIIDEISSGFRINTGGAHLVMGINPDIAVFSKAIGNGYAISVVIGKAEIMEAAQTSFISSTNWTERVGPTAALATIRKYRKHDVSRHLMDIGTQIQTGWQMLADKHGLPIEIGGIPPLSHFTFKAPNHLAMKALLVQLMLERGFLASTLFYSMFAHTKEHVTEYLHNLDKVMSELAYLNSIGKVESVLVGKPASAGFDRLN